MTEFINRRGWLVFFGVVLVGLGLLCLAMAALVMVGVLIGPQTPGVDVRMMLPASLFYVAIGVGFFILGIGSIMTRRWAQAITLVMSWVWLIVGIITTIGMAVMMPMMLQTMPAEARGMSAFALGCTFLFLGLFFIALPLAFVLFYRGPNVRATVEALDPVPRWTDSVPLPVLGFSLCMIFSAVTIVLWGFFYKALPVGPWMLEGLAVPAVGLFFTAVLLFIGFGSLKLNPAAWWTALGLLLVGAAYSVGFMMSDFDRWFEAMGMASDPRQVEMMKTMYSSPFFYAWMGVTWVVYLGFLIYLRRYFKTSSE